MALDASEMGSFHLWIDFWTSDDNSSETYQAIDLFMSDVAKKADLADLLDSTNEFVPFLNFCLDNWIVCFWSYEVTFIKILDNFIENRDHLGGKVYEAIEKLGIVLF